MALPWESETLQQRLKRIEREKYQSVVPPRGAYPTINKSVFRPGGGKESKLRRVINALSGQSARKQGVMSLTFPLSPSGAGTTAAGSVILRELGGIGRAGKGVISKTLNLFAGSEFPTSWKQFFTRYGFIGGTHYAFNVATTRRLTPTEKELTNLFYTTSAMSISPTLGGIGTGAYYITHPQELPIVGDWLTTGAKKTGQFLSSGKETFFDVVDKAKSTPLPFQDYTPAISPALNPQNWNMPNYNYDYEKLLSSLSGLGNVGFPITPTPDISLTPQVSPSVNVSAGGGMDGMLLALLGGGLLGGAAGYGLGRRKKKKKKRKKYKRGKRKK